MRWYYKLIEKGINFYLYAYSRESKDFDGQIRFDTETGKTTLVTPSAVDMDSKFLQGKAQEHFWKVVRDGFPEERSVCCG